LRLLPPILFLIEVKAEAILEMEEEGETVKGEEEFLELTSITS
jgi:hypothetical protein